jgi:hypothetical protein
MESLTAPMTRGFMEFAHANEKPVNWTQPATIKTAPAFVVRNHVGIGSVEPSPTNDIYPSWYVGGGAAKNSSQTIDRVSNKLATNCTPPLAKNVAANANAASWNIDIFNGGRTSVNTGGSGTGSTGSQPTDDVHNCNDSPPTVTLTTPTACDTSSCTITAVVTQGTHPLNDPQYAQFPGTVNFTLNGQVIHTQHVADSPSTVSFSYTPTSSGSGTLTVTVVDSVLYQSTNSATLTYTGPPVTAGRTNENTGNNNGTN